MRFIAVEYDNIHKMKIIFSKQYLEKNTEYINIQHNGL